ncbi:MAG TPA: hypothetical protein VFJ82_24020 [Longimicrobium sp.]|nr:hypothetical protein [Longimicrobium sp.]
MGLFDRNDYGRDYPGGGRSLGDRMRGAWNRFEQRVGGAMHHGYDRDTRFGREVGNGRPYHGGSGQGGDPRGYDGGYTPASFAYRGLDGAWSTARNRGAHDTQWDWRAAGGNRYDQDLGPRGGWMGPERGGRNGYDRGFLGGHRHDGYDRGWSGRGGYDRDLGRDRMRTDAGDPFGDRQGRTPFRVLRGGFDTEATDRGGWYQGNHLGGGDPNDVDARGWNHGIGDDPVYRPEDFRGRDRGRGRRGPF